MTRSFRSTTVPPAIRSLEPRPELACDDDGTPLCPAGKRLRHHQYLTRKRAHYYCCPALRKNRKGDPVFHADECPRGQNCCPEKVLGYTLYLPAADNLRRLLPIPRDSRRFKQLYQERTSTEHQNTVEDHCHLDRCCRNAAYMLIRLTFVNCCKHAVIRWREQRKHASEQALGAVIQKEIRII